MERAETPYEVYQTKGYSAKQTFATIFGGVLGTGVVIIIGFVVIKLVTALSMNTLEMLGICFIVTLLTLFAIGGSLGMVAIFRFIQKPGIQMPGILGKIEEKFNN